MLLLQALKHFQLAICCQVNQCSSFTEPGDTQRYCTLLLQHRQQHNAAALHAGQVFSPAEAGPCCPPGRELSGRSHALIPVQSAVFLVQH